MRKLISTAAVLLALLMCTACGAEDTTGKTTPAEDIPPAGSGGVGVTTDDTDKPAVDITIEDVLNHPESPPSDFVLNDDGSGGLMIRGYLGSSDIVVIPEMIDGKPITTIDKFAFANDSPVKGIKLSNGIKEIGELAFARNTNLQYVICGSGLETISVGAFLACSSLAEIRLNEGLKKISRQSFSGCESLKSLTIPSSVETIEVAAFMMMTEGFKIIGDAGSAAEALANDESFIFEAK